MSVDRMAPNLARFEQSDMALTAADAEQAIRTLYGMDGRATRLTGERDQNFRVRSTQRAEYLLKISHSAEEAEVLDFQTAILLHLGAGDARELTQHVQPGLDGHAIQQWTSATGTSHALRLLSFLRGSPLADGGATTSFLRSVGAALARLDCALGDFAHPADHSTHIWDLQHAGRLGGLAEHVEDRHHRALAQEGLALFRHRAEPRLAGLRHQVIHGDLNPHNVLIQTSEPGPRVGILDFGDAVRAPLVNDVAIAAAYHLEEGSDPLSKCIALVAGYHAVLPLERREADVLAPLIAGRLAMTVLITAWRAHLHPGNRAYILRNLPAALIGLSALLELGTRADDVFRAAVEPMP